jgi:hypothetical protein
VRPEEQVQVRLLAIDLGLRCGWAAFDRSGRPLGYGSRHFGNRSAHRRAIPQILAPFPELAILVLEGGGDLYFPWEKEARRLGLDVRQVMGEVWRPAMLTPSQRRNGPAAKAAALLAARDFLERSALKRPTSLRHDAAEAILVGAWASGRRPPFA